MEHTYLKFHKPFEVLSQFTDTEQRQTLKDFIDTKGVYAAGRLDYRSEGLLILTDDGKLIQQLSDPQFGHPKTYYAQVEGLITSSEISIINSQILLPGVQTRLASAEQISDPGFPARSTPVRQYHPTSWLKIVLHEGKKHQVRRLTAAVGFPTLRLIRVAIGNITVFDLEPGQWRYISKSELNKLYK